MQAQKATETNKPFICFNGMVQLFFFFATTALR